ncbi:hypothetical protein [Endozoicomonas atrinae]|uniref:hypothetical protein n=1 Tax=Endozoicomonas atrinae TaxID=1333660 RepID=UPI0008266C4B|nr:hypothetical protein [Endozoicomonas atrinae]
MLNTFQPEYLFAYSTIAHELALEAIAGRLHIEPASVLVSGDVLTPEARATINKAWGVEVQNLYTCSESMCIAIQRPGGDGMRLMEDENVLEILNADNTPVAPGEIGRVVLTPLYNRTLPIIRYDLGDYVTRGHRHDNEQFEPITAINGRVNEALPVQCADGRIDSIHPIVLSEFFVPSIQKFQFVSHSPTQITINYIAAREIDAVVTSAFQKILDMKGASQSVKVIPIVISKSLT